MRLSSKAGFCCSVLLAGVFPRQAAGGDCDRWRRGGCVALLVAIFSLAGPAVGRAEGQASLRDPLQPILVYQSTGHTGVVSSILFDLETGNVLTAGYDKVVHIWHPETDRVRHVRTIRPPVWRGPRGAIFSMDFSKKVDGKGERLLAIAGYGLEGNNGDFRLFQYPGKENLETGRQVAHLHGRALGGGGGLGHFNNVRTVRFDPSGTYLASGGDDGSVRLWNPHAETPYQFACLPTELPKDGPGIRCLVFHPQGTRLWTGSADGVVALWDVSDLNNPRLIANSGTQLQFIERNVKPADRPVNAMALSPDGATLVVGTEGGMLCSIDSMTLNGVNSLMRSGERGPIEAIAISPDGVIATSTVVEAYDSRGNQVPPKANCVIELRSFPEGQITSVVRESKNRILCLAFSPDGKTLAFAGDNSQSLFLKRLTDGALLEAKGNGSSLWEVGFSKQGFALGLSRNRADEPRPPVVQGFDLTNREPTLLPRSDLTGRRRTLGRWTIQAVDETHLNVTDGQVSYPIALPDGLDEGIGRWWDFTFVPSADVPEGEPPLVVVACDRSEALVYALGPPNPAQNNGRTYVLTRALAGHNAAVLSVAVSPDGKWLVTGSDDQTARLWLTKGWNAVPTLGVKVQAGDQGRPTIESLTGRGFGEMMGLEKGDLIEKIQLSPTNELPASVDALRQLDELTPRQTAALVVRRGNQPLRLVTSKRDNSALTLFVSQNLEWVIWTPESYYDTSIDGDRSYLGFHRNGVRPVVVGGVDPRIDLAGDTSFLRISQFEKQLRRPKLIEDLLASADPVVAYQGIEKANTTEVVAQNQPPVVRLGFPDLPAQGKGGQPLVTGNSEVNLNVLVDTNGFASAIKGLKQIRVLLDTGIVEAPTDFREPIAPIQPGQLQSYPFKIRLKPGLQRVSAYVQNQSDVTQQASLDVEFRPEKPVQELARPYQLHVITVGTGEFKDSKFNPIAKAELDLKDLAKFFADPTVQRYKVAKPVPAPLGKSVTMQSFLAALEELEKRRVADKLGQGDTVVISIETHLVTLDEYNAILVPFDADPQSLLATGVSTKEISARLGKLAAAGCHVLLLLDVNYPNGVRPKPRLSPARGLKEWVRELTQLNVMTFVAATTAPAQSDNVDEHGLFARAVLGSIDPRNRKTRVSQDEPMTYTDFKDVVEALVDRDSQSKQVARMYEGNIPLNTLFLAPPTLVAPNTADAR